MRRFTELLFFFLILKCLLCGSEAGAILPTRRYLTIYEDKFGYQNCLVFWGKLLFASREWSPGMLLSIPQYMGQTPPQILITSTLVIAQKRETLVCLKVNLTRFPSELKS